MFGGSEKEKLHLPQGHGLLRRLCKIMIAKLLLIINGHEFGGQRVKKRGGEPWKKWRVKEEMGELGRMLILPEKKSQ